MSRVATIWPLRDCQTHRRCFGRPSCFLTKSTTGTSSKMGASTSCSCGHRSGAPNFPGMPGSPPQRWLSDGLLLVLCI